MSTHYQKRLASIAQLQYQKYRLLRENEPPLSTQIEAYWTDLGLPFPGVSTAWSAVFVSWCVKQAGATPQQFPFSSQHSRFVHAAIKNARNGSGVFHGHEVGAYAPKLGDIVQNNRAGNRYDFRHAETHVSYASHSAVVYEVGVDNRGRYLRTIGGNESDSVGMKEVRLDSAGRIKNPAGLYIAVIETLL